MAENHSTKGFFTPSDCAELKKYPSVQGLVRQNLDPFLNDLQALLLLSRNEAATGLNFTIVSLIGNIVSGLSAVFYEKSSKPVKKIRNRGNIFRNLLFEAFPWDGEDVGPEEGSRLLYDEVRNPLVHSLGIEDPNMFSSETSREIAIVAVRINRTELPRLNSWPIQEGQKWQAFIRTPQGVAIQTAGLYQGLIGVIRWLFKSDYHMSRAEGFLKHEKDPGLRDEGPEESVERWGLALLTCSEDLESVCRYQDIGKALASLEKRRPELSSASMLWGLFRRAYADMALMALRRFVDVDSDAVSVLKIVQEIAKNRTIVTKQRLMDLWQDTAPQRIWISREFDEIYGVGAKTIPEKDLRKDLMEIRGISPILQKYANRRIAHQDERALSEIPNYDELEAGINKSKDLISKYLRLFRGAPLGKDSVPVADWERVMESILKVPSEQAIIHTKFS